MIIRKITGIKVLTKRASTILLYFLFTLIFGSVSHATSYDSLYIQQFRDKLTISPYISSSLVRVQFIPRPIDGDTQQHSAIYEPNLRGGFGIGISYRIIDFSLGFRQRLDPVTEAIYGKTDHTSLGFRLWATRHLLGEFTFQQTRGFANTATPLYDTARYSEATPYEHRADMSLRYVKLRAVYQFNPGRFSYRSSFSFSERQRKSAAGLLASASIYGHHLRSDSAFVPSRISGDFGNSSGISEFRTAGLALGLGGGATLRVGRFFATGVLFLGTDLQFFGYEMDTLGYRRETRMSTLVDLRLSFGYNGPRFFMGIQSLIDYNILNPKAVRVNSIFNRQLFTFGWRFNAPKIIEKGYDAGANLLVPQKYRHLVY